MPPAHATAVEHRPNAQNLAGLFDAGLGFRIPSYQRAYSWELKQIRQLLEDLREHPENIPYYYGHFLFEQGDELGEFLIIDGQQRLTTLVLFVAAIARELRGRNDDVTERLAELSRRYLDDRLKTVPDDQGVFEDLVRNGRSSDHSGGRSRKRLIDATNFLGKALRRASSELLISWLNILEKAEITTFTVHGKVQATQIFTLQNSRGKELTDLEKLKAFLMFGIHLNAEPDCGKRAIEKVEESFSVIYRQIELTTLLEEDAVLAHHDRAYSQHWEVPLENLKRELAATPAGVARVERITQYAKALQYSFQHVAALERLIQHDEVLADPVILDGQNSWPLLIKLYSFHGEEMKSDFRLRELLRNVEIVLLKLRFQHGRSSNDLIGKAKGWDGSEAKLGELCSDMRHYASRGFRWRSDFDQKMQAYLDADHHYNPTFRYILWKYENSVREAGDPLVLPQDYMSTIHGRRMEATIEHIAAQNGEYSEEFRNRWLNNLGNLLLMPRGLNSRISDRPPVEKAEMLNTSYKSHRDVRDTILEVGLWGEGQINKRKGRLIRFIQDRWRLPATEQPS